MAAKRLRRYAVWALCLLVIGALATPAMAGGPHPTWVRTTRFRANGVSAISAGGAIVVGATGANREDQVAVIRAYRPNGSIRWTTTWAPADGWAVAAAIAESADGIFVVGVMGPDVAPFPCHEIGSFTRFVLALSHRGHLRWMRGDTNWSNCHEDSATTVGAGGGMVVVDRLRTIEGYADYHARITAFTGRGIRVWTNGFEVPGIPWDSADAVRKLATDRTGRTYAAGNAWSRKAFDPPFDSEAVLQALTRDGARRWSKVFGEPTRWIDDRDRGTGVDVRGGRVLFGAVIDLVAPKGDRARVASFTTDGSHRWTKGFPIAPAYAATTLVTLGRSGRAYAAIPVRDEGRGGTDVVLRGFAANGRVLWLRTLGGARPGFLRIRDLDAGGGLFVLERSRLLRFPG